MATARKVRKTPWQWLTVARFGILLLILGLIAGVLGYRDQYPEPFRLRQVVTDFYGSISVELISIAFTVLILDQMYRRREAERDKQQLIKLMKSQDERVVAQTLERLRSDGSLVDGSLERKDLAGARLPGANLTGAILTDAVLKDADLSGANLKDANLEAAQLGGSHLTNANLSGAHLENAGLEGTRLTSANLASTTGLSPTELAKAHSLCGATMADGARYDGRFHLAGDLLEARKHDYDPEDRTSMARFYDVPLTDYSELAASPA